MMNTNDLLEIFKSEFASTPQASSPLYGRVENCILSVLGGVDLGIEDALPPERDLSIALNVPGLTLRKALSNLVNWIGLIQRRKALSNLVNWIGLIQRNGSATLVAGRVEQPLSRLNGFTEDRKDRDLSTNVKWPERSLGAATPDGASALNITPGAGISRPYGILYANEKPICIELAVLPAAILPDPEKC